RFANLRERLAIGRLDIQPQLCSFIAETQYESERADGLVCVRFWFRRLRSRRTQQIRPLRREAALVQLRVDVGIDAGRHKTVDDVLKQLRLGSAILFFV